MAEQFHPGEVVQLRSGGPPMTVVQVAPDRKVRCVWFCDKEAKYATELFDPHVLARRAEQTAEKQ
jgi:uncharacterized protein YodC (DUF2158 family)